MTELNVDFLITGSNRGFFITIFKFEIFNDKIKTENF